MSLDQMISFGTRTTLTFVSIANSINNTIEKIRGSYYELIQTANLVGKLGYATIFGNVGLRDYSKIRTGAYAVSNQTHFIDESLIRDELPPASELVRVAEELLRENRFQ